MAVNIPPNAGPFQNATTNALVFRQMSAAQTTAGVVDTAGFAVSPNGTPNMSVNVAAGRAWVPGTQVSNISGFTYNTQGIYFVLNDAPVNLVIAAANPTNPRIDLVVLQVLDQQYSGSSNFAQLAIVTGTPAATPPIPATPNNSIVLNRVLVPANATSITNANLNDYRTFAAPASSGSFQGRKNAIINGQFDMWQRGTSFAASGYTTDRWLYTLGLSATGTISQGIPVPGTMAGMSRYCLAWGRTVAGSGSSTIEQRIESVSTFAGQAVSVTVWAAAASGSIDFTAYFYQVFGTGGSPSSTVNTGFSQVFTATTTLTSFTYSFVMPSITGKTLGTNGNDYLSLVLDRSNLPVNGATGTLNIYAVQLELGATATTLEVSPLAETLAKCQRYYWRNALSTSGASYGFGVETTTTAATLLVQNPVTMRAAPTTLDWQNLQLNDLVATTAAVTALTLANASVQYVTLTATVASGLTAFRSCAIQNATAAGYLGLNAEL